MSAEPVAFAETPLALRPGVGTEGRRVELLTNYYSFRLLNNIPISQYAVDYEPELPAESNDLRRKIWGLARESINQRLGESIFNNTTAYGVNHVEGPLQFQAEFEGVNYKVILRSTMQFTTKNVPQNAVQFFNVLFRKAMRSLRLNQIGRKYFDASRAVVQNHHNLEIHPGFSTSIGMTVDDLLLHIDVAHRVLRLDSVLDAFYHIRKEGRGDFQTEAKRLLHDHSVLTRYNNRTYRVTDIDFNKNPDTKMSDSETQTFREYYASKYNKRIKDGEQPLLVVEQRRTKDRIYLVPELCSLTGLTDDMRRDFQLMKDMGQHTRLKPTDRLREGTGLVTSILGHDTASKVLANFNITISDRPKAMEGRVLPDEKVWFQTESTIDSRTADFWNNLRKAGHVRKAIRLSNWMVVHSDRDSDRRVAADFVQALERLGRDYHIEVDRPQMVVTRDSRAQGFLSTLEAELTPAVQIVVILLPPNLKDSYGEIKRVCCKTRPIPSQVVLVKTLQRQNAMMAVCTKVLFQMNVKLGGHLWALDVKLPYKSMVVGVDVYHDKGSANRSVVGFCASTNSHFTSYFSLVAFQDRNQELAHCLRSCMKQALQKFFTLNNFLPECIIVYRDGVSESQLKHLVEFEVNQFKAAFSEMGDNYDPRFMEVVVQKRITTRFFLSGGRDVENPLPGTVIDTGVVHPENYDFYLISQSVRQGSVTPTHYNVIYDNTKMPPDVIQRLSHKLCFLYYNWPGSIRVPAAVQYAHKLAYLVGQCIKEEPHQRLSELLYYL
eukprot:GILK01004178.1.p1 GENE.GILK01004178.1~~GILK01004178.1.p1  ORF type:complete len:796 (+),score=135.52 GILK01004178.1:65-2389(+)